MLDKGICIGISMGAGIVWLLYCVCLAFAPAGHADPGCFDSSSLECGGHAWNGPLRQTWDTPGYYGGWNNGNSGTELCSPFTYQCSGVAPTP